MDFDFTQYEYLPECMDGCGALTDWIYSKEAANDAGRNHKHEVGHKFHVRERMKP